MLGAGVVDLYFAGNLTGFTIGLVISVLLLVLVARRAAALPQSPRSLIVLAVCSLLWNAGGLANVVQHPREIVLRICPANVALALQFTGAGIWPVAMLAIWRRRAVEPCQSVGWRYLQAVAAAGAAVIVGGMWAAIWVPAIPGSLLRELAAYNATFPLLAAAALLLRGRGLSRAQVSSSLVVLAGLSLTTLSVFVQKRFTLAPPVRAAVGVVGEQAVLLVLIGTFFLFARFRFADLFIRYSIRILLASVTAAAAVLLIEGGWLRQAVAGAEYSQVYHFFVATIIATGLLVAFSRLDRSLARLINRVIFRVPDYQVAAHELGDRLRGIYTEQEVTAAAGKAVRQTLALQDVRFLPLNRVPAGAWPASLAEGNVVGTSGASTLPAEFRIDELELLVPVRTEGRVSAVLAVAPGPARRGLVSQEVNYLRSVAEQLGGRLDLLRLEREMAERQNREAVLQQQVAEAELRALRAQVNPHFLFNSLNTIANLVVTDPGRAETMTLRLAKVFRHVLAHSARPVVPIREEVEFLRSYLEIEEARFGDRLRVVIDIAPEVAHAQVPSLILQPVVENALKHGLAPKTGPGRLWITARPDGDRICLSVEDDGVGMSKTSGHRGVGLTNITQRLSTLYQDRAGIALERRAPEGTRVTLVMPREFAEASCAP